MRFLIPNSYKLCLVCKLRDTFFLLHYDIFTRKILHYIPYVIGLGTLWFAYFRLKFTIILQYFIQHCDNENLFYFNMVLIYIKYYINIILKVILIKV